MTASPTASLLVELLTEELPPRALARLSDAFAAGLRERLAAAGLIGEHAQVALFATPRRLAVHIDRVLARAPDRTAREKLLPVSVAFDAQGQPTAPLRKKLAALGLADVPFDTLELERAPDGKADAVFMSRRLPGATLADALQRALEDTLAKLPIPKTMSYQLADGATVRFVRPAHRLVALLGDTVLDVSVLGLQAGRITQGHRFLSDGDLSIAHADDYVATLRGAGKVLADRLERREAIRAQLAQAAGDDRVLAPDALLDEVNALVEWPVVYACRFDEGFLSVPQECLILTMQTNQKYFALTDRQGKLRSRFLVVSNIATADPADIVEGNERVIRPRLADAKFFFEQDQKKTLADRVPLLANVVYHNKLGSQLARVERIEALAAELAPLVGADPVHAARAARLAKADLSTEMVGEFPELQGTMGTYYARHDGEAADVALACSEHYRPRFAGDALPSTPTGTAVALADKLETLTGIWGIGLAPTGEKDPFALRRHALGVLRLLLEKALPVGLDVLLAAAYRRFAALPQVADATEALYVFLLDRLRGLLRERGYSANEVDAVLSQRPMRLDDLIDRLDAVRAFGALPEAAALAAANKRISNILKKAETVPAGVAQALLAQTAEQALFAQLEQLTPGVRAHLAARRYADALAALAGLRANVDTFFDEVMVNAEDAALRANRLALLVRLHAQMNCVADISKLAA